MWLVVRSMPCDEVRNIRPVRQGIKQMRPLGDRRSSCLSGECGIEVVTRKTIAASLREYAGAGDEVGSWFR